MGMTWIFLALRLVSKHNCYYSKNRINPDLGLPGDQLEPIIRTPLINSNFELEEGDIEMEQLKDLEAEAGALRQDESGPKEALAGTWLGFTREAIGRDTGIEDKEIKRLLATNKSLHGIPAAKRGDTYRYLVRKLDSKMKRDLKALLAQYRRDVDNLRIAKVSSDLADGWAVEC
jgi:hypothetical protein